MAKKRKNKDGSSSGKGGGKPNKNGVREEYQPKQPARSSARKRAQKKKQDDPSDDDNKLRNMVEADGRTIVDMNPDGNCLFRALSDQMFGDLGNNHDTVRHEICDFMEANKDDFQLFLVLDDEDCAEEDEDAKDFDSYMTAMRQDGEWGGNLELVAAARKYCRKITVFSATLAAYSIDHDGESSGPDLHVSFHDNDHYNSVRDENMTFIPPPKAQSTPPPQKKKQSKGKQKRGGSAKEAAKAGGTKGPKEPAKGGEGIGGTNEIGKYADCIETPPAKITTHKKDLTESNNKKSSTNVNGSKSELTVKCETGKHNQQQPNKTTKPPKKNETCPCGSGLRYKKCCLAKQKHTKRLESMKSKSSSFGDEGTGIQPEVEMKGNFRVLQI